MDCRSVPPLRSTSCKIRIFRTLENKLALPGGKAAISMVDLNPPPPSSPSGSTLLATLLRLAILALGVTLATKLVPGISCDDGLTLLAVVVLLTFFNWILKPLLVMFTLPFIVLTLGLGLIVINAIVFLLVGHLVAGFHVAGFGTAILGSIVISLTNFIVTMLIRRSRAADARRRPPPRQGGTGGGSDAIDI